MGLEKILKELSFERKKQEKRVISSLSIIKKYLCDTYLSGNLQEISQCQEKVNNFINYVKQEFGIDIPTQKEREERLKEQEVKLIEVLKQYKFDQLIPKKELSEKSGLNLRQLSAYTKGKNAFIGKDDKYPDHYKLKRAITKEQADQANEKFIGGSGNVHKDHKDYLEEKIDSDKPHF